MKPGETVQKAICRLGGSSSRSASTRWKKKKDSNALSDEANQENHEKLQILTRLADDIIQSGDMDIYQQTYEKLSFHMSKSSNGSHCGLKESTENEGEDMDMFGEDFDEKVDETKAPIEPTRTPSPTSGMFNSVFILIVRVLLFIVIVFVFFVLYAFQTLKYESLLFSSLSDLNLK